jgi:hypothetical protein
MVGFVKSYLPVFMPGDGVRKGHGAVRFLEIDCIYGHRTGQTCTRDVVDCTGVCGRDVGGVSLFVVVFAVYPFAAEMFRQSGIPKRLIPCTVALGAFTFTMDPLPGSPQITSFRRLSSKRRPGPLRTMLKSTAVFVVIGLFCLTGMQ